MNVLPKPEAPFGGTIGATLADSKSSFPAPIAPPAGAPNVLVVLTDDVGFAAASTFGGPVPTPSLDRLAREGLVYNRFHTTAMCSPTRAALLTGRNHHAVHNGIVANLTTGFPGYDNLLPKSAATIAEILRQNGYNTAMFGKHHNAPEHHVSAAGPFDLWPTGLGFEYFFGFMAAETNQFTPALYRGITPLSIHDGTSGEAEAAEPRVLDEVLTDDAILWLHNQQAAAPGKPFFLYYATGTAHAPLQAPADWIAKFEGRFDTGWDRMRADIVARQKKQGIVPRGTVNTPRPEGIPAWKDLTPEQRRINARFMEVYAGMLAHQDHQFGRLLGELERMGLAENTLVVFIEGDNGASAEGGLHGSMNPMSNFANGTREDEQAILARLGAIGGPQAVPNWGYGWAWATNAPLRLTKSYASHLGGTRNGMVLAWPARIESRGIRPQFSHVTDIVPTILEAVGIAAPEVVNGVPQQPMDGIDLAYTFDAPKAPERHRVQYFEMLGNRAIYADGWLASTTPASAPWDAVRSTKSPADYAWELYDLRRDFSQGRDLAAREPEKLAELQALFLEEAKRNQVLPLDNRLSMDRFLAAASQLRKSRSYTYWGPDISVPVVSAAPILNRSFTITAEIVTPAVRASQTSSTPKAAAEAPAANGVVVALGSRFGGWSFHVERGVPVALMAASQLEGDQSRVAASSGLPTGRSILAYQFVSDGGVNAGGELIIRIDGREVGRGRIARTISKLPEMTDTFDIGFDADTPVSDAYEPPGRFDAEIRRVDVTLD
ncbi:MAG: arylsulfatase [Myxococcota bacterium]